MFLYIVDGMKKVKKDLEKAVKRGGRNDFLSLNATRMKKAPTEAEEMFKKILQEKCIPFDEQVPFMSKEHKYIFDFVVARKWVVEIDGGYHNTYEQKEKDKKRDEYLTGIGYKVRRFTNSEIMNYSMSLHNWLNGIYGGYRIKQKNNIKGKNSYKQRKAKFESERLDKEFLEKVNDIAS